MHTRFKQGSPGHPLSLDNLSRAFAAIVPETASRLCSRQAAVLQPYRARARARGPFACRHQHGAQTQAAAEPLNGPRLDGPGSPHNWRQRRSIEEADMGLLYVP